MTVLDASSTSAVRKMPMVVCVGVLFVAGCALNQTGNKEVSTALAADLAERQNQIDRYVPTTKPAPVSTQALVEPQTLQDFLEFALQKNPEILAAAQNAYAKACRIPQVTALPNPQLMTSTFTPNRPMMLNDGNNVFNLTLTQQIPHPEKLDRAGRIALEETRMAIKELDQTRLRVIADVKRSWYQLYILDQSIRITRESRQLLAGIIDVARSQVASNKRPQDDVLRAQVELSDLDRELIEYRQNRQIAAAALNNLIDRSPYAAVPSPSAFDIQSIGLKIDDLLTQACKFNPELKRFEHQVERDRQARKLANLSYWPDFTIGFQWSAMEPRNDPSRPESAMALQPDGSMMPMTMMPMGSRSMDGQGKDMFAIMAGVDLPIWFEKNQAMIREAEYNLSSSIQQYNATKNMVYFRVQDALSRVLAQQQLVEILRSTIIPQAKQAYEVTQSSYAAGMSDFPSLIDAWRKWLTYKLQYQRAIGELERSYSDLEQQLGISISEMGAGNEQPRVEK